MIPLRRILLNLLLIGPFQSIFINTHAQSQTYTYSPLFDNLNPVTPSTWQFVKYDELPVSEYTGIPNISVPLYEIDQDDIKIPLALTYHAGGIRVNEDASWVGLGWDLQVGSIIQTVNDKDDLSKLSNGSDKFTKILPDFTGGGPPTEYPYRFDYSRGASGPGPGWTNPFPILSPQYFDTYMIETAGYLPVNGNFDTDYYGTLFGGVTYDSEPDIFKANFLGYSVEFMMDWGSVNKGLSTYSTAGSTNSVVVLNRKGYKVTFNADGSFTIIVPDGDIFTFQLEVPIHTQSYTVGVLQGGSNPFSASTKVWMLTNIVTKNKNQVTFNYNTTTSPYYDFQNHSESWFNSAVGPSQNIPYSGNPFIAYDIQANTTGYAKTTSVSSEPRCYLSSIVFPKGQVNFITSPTTDILGGQKLDSIAVVSNQPVKTYKFNYAYFNTSGTGGNTYPLDTIYHYGTTASYRLKLNSLRDNSGATYTFNYNSTPLPNKNSLAQDYWGYYNGQLSNTTLIPNPAQFNLTGLGNNGDNHSANLTSMQAGSLQEIVYPTGGKVDFGYELNTFNNYWVPDFGSSTNTISHGNGLRIHSVTYRQADGTQAKQDVYAYSTGKALLPVNFFRNSTIQKVVQIYHDFVHGAQVNSFNLTQVSAAGYYSSSPFSSITGVGYDTVSHQEMDLSGSPIGKTVTTYFNNPDILNNSILLGACQLGASLPALKNVADPENGSVGTVAYYDQSNNKLKKVVNSYTNANSSLYYGFRIFGYADLWYWYGASGGVSGYFTPVAQSMVGFYPFLDFETLPTGSVETDYFGADSVVNTTSNSFDSYRQLFATTHVNSDNTTTTTNYEFPYTFPGNPVLADMVTRNRLADVVSVAETKIKPGSGPLTVYTMDRSYKEIGPLIVAAKDSVDSHPGLGRPTLNTYDQYDSNGNILQYTDNTIANSLIWDYNNQYVIAAAKNAAYTNVAYTSFEADGAGRWKFTGTPLPDNNAPTGEHVYSLSNGNVYRDSLATPSTYIVSYWSKNGAQTVSGSSATKQGYTFNGYTYYEHTIINPSAGKITISGTGTIDELRLYPNIAQMTSYTYAPLVGITSESGAGGKISYYEYDGSMRLLDIRDQNKHILKAFCYNFAGQPTTCGLDITYSNQPLSQAFTRNNCSTGYMSLPVTYTVPAGKYTSTMSLLDANNQASFDINSNGQAYANTTGTCFIPPAITTINYQGHANLVQVVFGAMPGCATATIHYTDTDTSTPYSQTGGCSSPQNVTIPVTMHHYSFTITFYPSNYTTAPFNYFANF